MIPKIVFSSLVALLVASTGFAQDQNPFESIGKKGHVLTLSEGKYDEFFEKDSLERIGTVLIDRYRRNIKSLDVSNAHKEVHSIENQSRFLSVDPITKEFAQLSPYQYASNRPIDGTDIDGLEYKRVVFWIDGYYGDGSPKLVKTATEIKQDIVFTEYSLNSGKPTGRYYGKTDVFYIDKSTGNITQGNELYEEISSNKPVPSAKYDYTQSVIPGKDKDDDEYVIHQYARNDFLAMVDILKRDANAPDNAETMESLGGLAGVAAIIGAPFQIRGLQAAWVEESTAGWSTFSKAYQKQITGQDSRAIELNGVKFDGIKGTETLVDAKGHYEYLLQKGWAQEGLLEQAKRQIQAAKGLNIEWHFAEKGAADAVKKLFEEKGIKGIEVFHTPSVTQ